jgi:putative spermidine/putrescine transport system ATP-binding protein
MLESQMTKVNASPTPVAGGEVSVRGLIVDYGGVRAVNDVSFDVQSGEFLTLLGPSGSGKTTTLMALAGFILPNRGTISLDGRDITNVAAHRRGLGVVFQNYALFPHMTVLKNVAFPLEMRRLPRDEVKRRAAGALELVHLGPFADRYPTQLSGGQQQRVALARALVYKPSLLLMDEPLGALDKKLRELMQLELKQTQEQLGISFVYVTHDQDEALRMSTRIAVMNHGRIEQLGNPRDIYQRPANRFVADFIGQSHFLNGRIVPAPSGKGRALRTELGTVIAVGGREDSSAGEACLAIRPEKIAIGAAASGLDNAFEATIDREVYGGNATMVFVRLPNGERMFVTGGDQELADSAASSRTIAIGWSKDAGVLVEK